jgi:hypothetical protein
MNCEFDDLIGFEGYYKINRNGDIYSCKRKRLLTQHLDRGYMRVNLTKDNVGTTPRIHRLLAIQYIPNPDNLPEIDHIDRNKLNNNLENLRWVSHTTNARNVDFVINKRGSITIEIRKYGTYYRGTYCIDFGVRKHKKSKDREVVEEWLEEMRNKYPYEFK